MAPGGEWGREAEKERELVKGTLQGKGGSIPSDLWVTLWKSRASPLVAEEAEVFIHWLPASLVEGCSQGTHSLALPVRPLWAGHTLSQRTALGRKMKESGWEARCRSCH